MRKLTMRRSAIVALLCIASCANPSMPRGAPPDAEAPELVRTVPDSAAVRFNGRDVEFVFNEVVSEQPAGAPDLSRLFLISPGTGDMRVSWQRRAIAVRPREGWLPNTTYTVTMLAGMGDLQNNVRRDGASIVFSTGDSLDNARISGFAFDWVTERPAPRATILAHRLVAVDTTRPAPRDTVLYSAVADSLGRYTLRNLPAGVYEIRGFIDTDANRTLEKHREKYDTARVVLADSANIELLMFQHDSVGPDIQEVTLRDSVTLVVRFSRPIDPGQQLDTTRFRLLSATADSSPVPIVAVRVERPGDVKRTPEDSARADSVARADSIRLAAIPIALRPARPAVPSRPAPPQALIVQLATALTPGGRYLMRATGMRGLLGIAQPTATRAFQVPPRRPPPRPSPGRPHSRVPARP